MMNKKQRMYAFAIGLSMLFMNASAQENHAASKKNEVGVSMGGFIFNYGDYGLLYKRQIKDNLFLRASLASSINLSTFASSSYYGNSDFTELSPTITTRLGFEKRKPILNNKGQFYWGIDLGHSFSGEITFEEDTTIYERINSVYIKPLLGMRYFITPQISLGCEFDFLTAGYYWQNSDGPYSASTKTYINLSPTKYLMLSYHF